MAKGQNAGSARRRGRVVVKGTQNIVDRKDWKGTDQAAQLVVITDQATHFVGAHESGVDVDPDRVTGDLVHPLDDFIQSHTLAGAEVDGLVAGIAFQQAPVNLDHEAHVGKVAHHVQVAELDHRFPPPVVRDDLGDEEMLFLADAGVVEGPGDDQRQAVLVSADHVFHRQFAGGVVIDRRGTDRLVDDLHRRVAVDVGAARDQYFARL